MASPIELKVLGLEEIRARLAGIRHGVETAAARALNRSIAVGATLTVRRLAQVTGLVQKRVRPVLGGRRASARDPIASLRVTGHRPIPLLAYRKLVSVRQGKYGRYPVLRGNGPGLIPTLSARAFVATVRSGHVGAFERRGRARLPLDALAGPQLPDVMRATGLETEVRARIAADLQTRFLHEVEFLVSKAGGAGAAA